MSRPRLAFRRFFILRNRSEVGYCLLLLAIITIVWCAVYRRWTPVAWATPIVYSGDGLTALAGAKALSRGEITPFLTKNPYALGAPFVANWNDYPSTEEGILAWLALFASILGPFSGANAAILSAHLLAGGTFYLVCRYLRYDRACSLAAAILFSLSRDAFARSLPHFTLTFYWHIPLGLLAVWWCLARSAPLLQPRKIMACLAIALLFGVQSPYYTWLFAQFFLLAALVCFLRCESRKAVVLPLLSAAALFVTFLLMNADTFYYKWVNGPNAAAISARSYADLERYALKGIELLVPLTHRIPAVQNWAAGKYFSQALFLGEIDAPYLGIIGILSLFWLIFYAIRAIARSDFRIFPSHFWLALWTCAYSSVGGIGALAGMFGLILFRATDRFSIVILAVVLFFFARQTTRLTRTWRPLWRVALALVSVIVGLFDQLPPMYAKDSVAVTHWQMVSDRTLVADMENRLPKGAMVLQLPVIDFPESPPVERMTDYEQLRPYLHSHTLRFSYGTDKGRPRDGWLKLAEQGGAASLVKLGEQYGFSCLLINKFGYKDSGASLLAALRGLGHGEIIAESYEFVCVRLQPVPNPVLPTTAESAASPAQ